ncbi:10532_t:CDS:1 [Funneliformis geosporum]|nr:10532_t:CDS:1 [Funneliformis geosporum]
MFAEQIAYSYGWSMFMFSDLSAHQTSPLTSAVPLWFKTLESHLCEDIPNRKFIRSLLHSNEFSIDLTKLSKLPNKQSFVLGWNLDANQPFIGNFLRIIDNTAHV